MDATLLDHANLRVCDIYEANGEHDHYFGGPVRHFGDDQSAIDRRIRLLMSFDLADHRLGLQLPGLRTLPIYYAFHNPQGSFAYRIISETQIEVLGDPYLDVTKEMDDELCRLLPHEFTQRRLRIDVSDYDPTNTDDLMLCGSEFGVGRLTVEQQVIVKNRLEAEHPELFAHSHTKLPPYDSLTELISHIFSFMDFPQGAPNDPCPNGACPNHNCWSSCQYLLVIDSHPDDLEDLKLFREAIAGEDSGRLQVSMCPLCFSIRIFNVCT